MSATNVPCKFLAQLFGVSERRVQQLAKEGVIPKAERGEYPLLASVKSYVKSLQGALRHGGGRKFLPYRVRLRCVRQASPTVTR